jgi:hypothetical protein
MVGLTFGVLAVIALGTVVLLMGFSVERLARRRRGGSPPTP